MSVPVVVLAAALVMMGVELVRPGRSFPQTARWWARAIGFNAVQVGSAYLAVWTWDRWMYAARPWSLEGIVGGRLDPNLGGLVGYFAITFVYYWWHRARHAAPLLWRWVHQLHHSPQRIEIITSFYKHPIEVVSNAVLSSAILYWLVGLGPLAATYAILLSGLAELVYHWNVRTPYWLGFFFQRPESHCVHHQLGLHRFNYGDLPLWDMLFGTFHNPHAWDGRCGFADDRELRVAEMLRGVDVNAEPIAEPAE